MANIPASTTNDGHCAHLYPTSAPVTPVKSRHQRISAEFSSSRPPSQNSSTSSSQSSPSKSPCRQCAILKRRMKQQYYQSFHRSPGQGSPGSSQSGASPPPTPPGSTSTPPQPQTVAITPRELSPAEAAAVPPAAQQPDSVRQLTEYSGKMSSSAASWAFVCIFATSLLVIFTTIYRVQPAAYIDEIFHIPQAQKYCQEDNFSSWDSKITTPPGLYLVSYAIIRPLATILGVPLEIACSIDKLRLTNVLFSFANFVIIWAILKAKLASTQNATQLGLILRAITLALFPPLFFFSFLYYTDPGSMFTILLTQWAALQGHHHLAAYAGFASLWFRQTNIVWIFFPAGLCCLNIIFNLIEDVANFRKYQFFLLGFTKRFSLRDCTISNRRYVACLLIDLFISVLSTCGGYLLNGILFIGFLYLNNGIVLGDRSAHQAVLHLAQIPYFLTFTTFIGAPVIFTLENARQFWRLAGTPRGALLFLLSTSTLYFFLSDRFLYVHPYLLADNRHYVFYVWRRLWSNPNYPELRIWSIPVYVFTLVTMWSSLDLVQAPEPTVSSPRKSKLVTFRAYQNILAKLLFGVTILVTIVPQQLVEFRYFLVPYLLWRLHIKQPQCRVTLALEFLWALLINIATMYLFTTKTIKYSEAEPNARLIW